MRTRIATYVKRDHTLADDDTTTTTEGTELEPGTHKPGDSVFDAFQPETDLWGPGADGLPAPIEKDTGDGPLPFTPENLVCMKQETCGVCVYYKRQITPLGEHHDQRSIDRWCLHPGMRALNGAALNLSESAMFACELRDPPHPESAKLLDDIDENLLQRATGPAKFWSLFRTPEQAAAGVTTLGEDDYETKRTGL